MNKARLMAKLMIFTKYDLKFAVWFTERFVTLGFVTPRVLLYIDLPHSFSTTSVPIKCDLFLESHLYVCVVHMSLT